MVLSTKTEAEKILDESNKCRTIIWTKKIKNILKT